MINTNGLTTQKNHNTIVFNKPIFTSQLGRSSGLTLIELLVVLAIASILISLAIPSFNTLYRTTKANTAIAAINQALTYTRIVALEQGQAITLCASSDQTNCSQQWNNPLIIFKDANNNQIIDGQEALLRTVEQQKTFTVNWSAFGNKHYITYSAIGTINHTNGSLTLCPNDNNNRYGRIIIINKGGRARLAIDNDGTGVVNKADGEDLECG